MNEDFEGEEEGDTLGGADIDFRDFLGPAELFRALARAGEGRIGEDDSAPD